MLQVLLFAFCGSGRARESGVSVIEISTDPLHSRASPLPHKPERTHFSSGFSEFGEIARQSECLAHEHCLGFGHLVDDFQAGIAQPPQWQLIGLE